VGEVAKGPEGEEHQANEKEGSEGEDAIDHFSLGNEVHEITRNEKTLATSDEESNADVDGSIAEGNIRCPHGDDCAHNQRVKNKKITPDVMAEMFVNVRSGSGGRGVRLGVQFIGELNGFNELIQLIE